MPFCPEHVVGDNAIYWDGEDLERWGVESMVLLDQVIFACLLNTQVNMKTWSSRQMYYKLELRGEI